MNIDNSNNYHTEPHLGFKFRNLGQPGVYYDEVHRRLMLTYRTLFLSYANYQLMNNNDNDKCIEILDQMNKLISPELFPINYETLFNIARVYSDAGAKQQTIKYGKKSIEAARYIIDNNTRPEEIEYEIGGKYFGPYRRISYMYEIMEQYDNANAVLEEFFALSQQKAQAMRNYPQYREQAAKIEYNLLDLTANINENKIMAIRVTKGLEAAISQAKKMKAGYEAASDQASSILARYLAMKLNELEAEAAPDSVIADASKEK
jgi:hypothetical protein